MSNQRDPSLKNYAVIAFALSIAVIGWLMMTVTSSPNMKGAAMLWLPAALQLVAGVWLGPVRGMIAGGLGAYAAGILAYGGWGLADIIMNPIAGGIANAWLPAILFSMSKIDLSEGFENSDLKQGVFTIIAMLIITIIVGMLPIFTDIGNWAYLAGFAIVSFGLLLTKQLSNKLGQSALAIFYCVLISAISAAIGTCGAHVAGNSWEAAFLQTGLGWFLGDTVSCVLGLYILAFYTKKARDHGIA